MADFSAYPGKALAAWMVGMELSQWPVDVYAEVVVEGVVWATSQYGVSCGVSSPGILQVRFDFLPAVVLTQPALVRYFVVDDHHQRRNLVLHQIPSRP